VVVGHDPDEDGRLRQTLIERRVMTRREELKTVLRLAAGVP
jgi:hypothetical protein